MNKALLRLLQWPIVMIWHMWRILCLRPYFAGIPDNRKAFAAFLGLYVAAGCLRWFVAENMDLPKVLLNLSIQGIALILFFERGHRSSSLVLSMFGASAAWDVIGVGVALAGFPSGSTAIGWAISALEFSTCFVCWTQFKKEPAAVQASGYMRTGEAVD